MDAALRRWPELLEEAGLRRQRERDLRESLGALMRGFTTDRSQRPGGYLGRWDYLEAYLWWYVPLNLLKLRNLLPRLNPPPARQVTDFGCGPWTLVLAIHLLLPSWRATEVGWTLVDPESAALDAGRRLFDRVCGTLGGATGWRFSTVRGRLGVPIRRPADLVLASHALNEWPGEAAAVADIMLRDTAPDVRVLVVEPGTRLAVRRLAALRERLIQGGVGLVAPCPHHAACPAAGRTPRDHFCHFPATAELPGWMADTARRLGIAKDTNTFSFLYGGRGRVVAAPSDRARVISGPLRLHDGREGHYLCTQEGLRVGLTQEGAAWGDLVRIGASEGLDPLILQPRVRVHPVV